MQLVKTVSEMQTVSQALAESGYFKDASSAAQAFVKVLAGNELGFPSFASMTGIHIISGKPTIGANLIAAAIKRSQKYNYKIIKLDDTICELQFFENGKESGISAFSVEDAKKQGTQNIGKFPRNMLFARAISNGARWFCPDLFLGAAVYTPDELGAKVDDDGNVIEVEVIAPKSQKQEAPEAITAAQVRSLGSQLKGFFGDDKERMRLFVGYILSKDINSIKDLSKAEASGIIDTLDAGQEDVNAILAGFNEEYPINHESFTAKLSELVGNDPLSFARMVMTLDTDLIGNVDDLEALDDGVKEKLLQAALNETWGD